MSVANELLKSLTSTPEGKKEFLKEKLILDVTERICELMEEKKISRSELASRLGVTKSRISQMLGGTTNMTLRSLSDIFFELDRAVRLTDTQCSETVDKWASPLPHLQPGELRYSFNSEKTIKVPDWNSPRTPNFPQPVKFPQSIKIA